MRKAVALALCLIALPAAAQEAAPAADAGATATTASAPDAADRPSAMETYRRKVVTVYGNDPCPAAQSPDEVIVCARRPEEERYRLRTVEQQPGARTEQGGLGRVHGADSTRLAGGSGTCTTVGPNGPMGCTRGIDLLGLGAWLNSLATGEADSGGKPK